MSNTQTHTMNNYRNTLTAAARVLSIMRDDAQREIEELESGSIPTLPNQLAAAKYRRTYAADALEALLCVDPEQAKGAERYMRSRI